MSIHLRIKAMSFSCHTVIKLASILKKIKSSSFETHTRGWMMIMLLKSMRKIPIPSWKCTIKGWKSSAKTAKPRKIRPLPCSVKVSLHSNLKLLTYKLMMKTKSAYWRKLKKLTQTIWMIKMMTRKMNLTWYSTQTKLMTTHLTLINTCTCKLLTRIKSWNSSSLLWNRSNNSSPDFSKSQLLIQMQ